MKRAQTEWKEHKNKWKKYIKTIEERICFVHKSVMAFHRTPPEQSKHRGTAEHYDRALAE